MTPDAGPVAYRPLPEGPSPRWQRAAAGLRLLRIALLVQLAFSSLARGVRGYGEIRLFGEGASMSHAQTSFAAAGVLHMGWALGSIVVAAGLWSFAQAPASTRVPGPARTAFWLQVAGLAFSLLSSMVFRVLAPTWGGGAVGLGLVSAALSFVGVVLHGAWLVLFVRALDHARQAAGSLLPGWAPTLVAGTIGWHLMGLLGGSLPMMLARISLAAHVAVLGVGLSISVWLTLALVRLVRLAEQALARQQAPVSEVG